jgi:HEAT repeat protein
VGTKLHFTVDPSIPEDPKVLQSVLAELKSDDAAQRREAARTLASFAPESAEDTLLGFANSIEFRQFAPLAFYRLNTPRSMKALADMLTRTNVGSPEYMDSASYLAKSNDPQWFPVLLDIAKRYPGDLGYAVPAAELGGDKMLPTLISLSNSPDKQFARVNAVEAMGYTGSRDAVPVLLDLLKNPDTDIAGRARNSLQLLTHRTAGEFPSNPQPQYFKWSQWWAREGDTAPIYKASECGDFEPLQ